VRKLALLAVAAAAALVLTAVSLGASRGMGWSATLTAAQEVPKQAVKVPAAKGAFHATLSGKTLSWKLTFSHLSGRALQAHIHLGAMGKSGNVLVPLCAPCKSGMTGKSKVTAAMIRQFGKHLLYVNVHTAKNPAGEIRGQLGG
jgi:CHRD domain-containing protein